MQDAHDHSKRELRTPVAANTNKKSFSPKSNDYSHVWQLMIIDGSDRY
jgi:hypothetical protein